MVFLWKHVWTGTLTESEKSFQHVPPSTCFLTCLTSDNPTRHRFALINRQFFSLLLPTQQPQIAEKTSMRNARPLKAWSQSITQGPQSCNHCCYCLSVCKSSLTFPLSLFPSLFTCVWGCWQFWLWHLYGCSLLLDPPSFLCTCLHQLIHR